MNNKDGPQPRLVREGGIRIECLDWLFGDKELLEMERKAKEQVSERTEEDRRPSVGDKWRGCEDSGCKFATDLSGQRTNGGCHCLQPLSYDTRLHVGLKFAELEAENRTLKKENERIREALEKLRHWDCSMCTEPDLVMQIAREALGESPQGKDKS